MDQTTNDNVLVVFVAFVIADIIRFFKIIIAFYLLFINYNKWGWEIHCYALFFAV